MAKAKLISAGKKRASSVELPDQAFDAPLNRHLLYESVRHYLACGRRGTHKAKNRVEVRGGGKKPFKQKGTGRARAGSIRSPLWKGGGVVHGPRPRDYSYSFNKKARRRALASALSEKLRRDQLKLVDGWELDSHKTKELSALVNDGLGVAGKTVLVYDGDNKNIELATRNNPHLRAVRALQLHPYHVLDCETILISKAAAEQIGEVLSR